MRYTCEVCTEDFDQEYTDQYVCGECTEYASLQNEEELESRDFDYAMNH